MKRTKLAWRVAWAVALWGMVGLGGARCAGGAAAAPGIVDAALRDGRQVRALLATDRPNAVLAYSTDYAFSCAATLNRWNELHRQGRVNLVLLLTDPPSAPDRQALARRRIHVSGVLASRTDREPREYLVDGRTASVVVESGARTGRRSELLKRVEDENG